jgi:hypothetical protein
MSEESRKRKADEQNGHNNSKKARLGSPVPIILDEFETEAKREVEAHAGLTGAEIAAGQTISLVHQVSILKNTYSCLIQLFRSDIKLQYLPHTITYPSQRTFLIKILHGLTLSNWTLFKRSPYTLFNGTSLFSFPPTPALEKLWWRNTPLPSVCVASKGSFTPVQSRYFIAETHPDPTPNGGRHSAIRNIANCSRTLAMSA